MESMTTLGPERETVLRAASGDGAAFRLLVEGWRGRVYGFCWRMTGNRATAEDLAQEVFLHLFQVLRRWDPDRPFAPWMRRVMTNVVLNRLRGRRLPVTSLDLRPDGAPLPPDPRAEDPLASADRREALAHLRVAMAGLPPTLRTVVALRYTEDLSVAEIADALELPENTVKTRLFRAREALRIVLTPASGNGGGAR